MREKKKRNSHVRDQLFLPAGGIRKSVFGEGVGGTENRITWTFDIVSCHARDQNRFGVEETEQFVAPCLRLRRARKRLATKSPFGVR